MGQLTPKAQVWYPAITDTIEINTLMATMASSIENGIQPRLALQEIAVGLKAGFTSAPTLSSALTVAGVTVNSANGSFAQGLTIAGGIVTVTTPGMYLISGSLGITNISSHTAKIELRKGAIPLAADEQISNPSFYQVAKQTTVVNCIAGDTLCMMIADAAGGAGVAANLALTHFTVAMIQAVPA